MTLASIRKQIAELRAIVKPSTSLAARIEKLTDEQRDWYEKWTEHCKRFIERHPDGEAYARVLDGYGLIGLREDIRITLVGPTPTIPITVTEDDAGRIYREYYDA